MRLPKSVMPIVAIITLLGSVAVAQLMGWWAPPVSVENMTSPEQIRGWMTFQDVSTRFNIPMAELFQKLALPANTPPTTPMREMESADFDVEKVRELVEEYLKEKGGPQ